ncbi:MAG TPA: Na+-transporting NADH:ubiquinone oxidoreductase subunit NqrC [Kosmotogaceae bacterium]|nr:Na+-transporting NADH:ubiquinone oxidoreductase subunit NqrC [Kosmotogaceae bacterium]
MEDEKMSPRVYGIFYTFVVSAIFVAMLAFLNAATRNRIIENEEIRLQTSILIAVGVLHPDDLPQRDMISSIFSESIRTIQYSEGNIYLSENNQEKVIAFLVSSPGLWGTITAVVAINESYDRLAGIEFYEHSETPGLGGRIDELDFKNQFKGLLISEDPEARISVVRFEEDVSKERSSIAAITGATRTSESIQELINRAINSVLPVIAEVLGDNNGG